MNQSVIRLSINILVTLLILSIGGFWGIQSFAKEWSPTQKEIWEMEKTYWKLWRQRDLDGLMALHHKDYVGWTFLSEKPVNKTSYRDLLKSKIGKYNGDLDTFAGTKRLEVKIFGNVAIAYYVWNIEHGRGRSITFDYSIRFTHIWMKQDDKWEIIGGMSTRID
jgi:ketosteroid isomerase-like protein